MTDEPPLKFRVACYSAEGPVQHKMFDTEVAANAWAAENINDFDKLIVERLDSGGWNSGATFSHR